MPRVNISKRDLYLSHLSIATCNIQGLKSMVRNKTQDTGFLNEIHHIIGLTETHCSDEDDIHIPVYLVHQLKSPRTGRKAHGGIAFLVKSELKPGITFQ